MDLFGAVLVVLVAVRPSGLDAGEDPNARYDRLGDLAYGIADGTDRATCQGRWEADDCVRIWRGDPESLAGGLVTVAVGESALAWRVQAKPHPDKHGWAASYFGLHATSLVPDWPLVSGLEPDHVRRAAWGATRALSAGFAGCGSMRGAMARYAKGHGCKWSGAKARANTAWYFAARIRASEER